MLFKKSKKSGLKAGLSFGDISKIAALTVRIEMKDGRVKDYEIGNDNKLNRSTSIVSLQTQHTLIESINSRVQNVSRTSSNNIQQEQHQQQIQQKAVTTTTISNFDLNHTRSASANASVLNKFPTPSTQDLKENCEKSKPTYPTPPPKPPRSFIESPINSPDLPHPPSFLLDNTITSTKSVVDNVKVTPPAPPPLPKNFFTNNAHPSKSSAITPAVTHLSSNIFANNVRPSTSAAAQQNSYVNSQQKTVGNIDLNKKPEEPISLRMKFIKQNQEEIKTKMHVNRGRKRHHHRRLQNFFLDVEHTDKGPEEPEQNEDELAIKLNYGDKTDRTVCDLIGSMRMKLDPNEDSQEFIFFDSNMNKICIKINR